MVDPVKRNDRAAAADPLEILVDDAELRISRNPGSSGLTVISFAGIGEEGGHVPYRQREEFRGSLAASGNGTRNLIYVVDRRRSWMNGTGERIIKTLVELTADQRSVVTLGNSMGGFSALWAAGRLPNCRRAIAFSPQFSVNPEHMPPDPRWQELRAAIPVHDVKHAMEHRVASVDYWVVYGDQKRADERHAALLKQHGGDALRLVKIAGGTHDVARGLRSEGVLSDLLRLLISEAPVTDAEVAALLPKQPLPGRLKSPETAAKHRVRRELRKAAQVAARQAARATD